MRHLLLAAFALLGALPTLAQVDAEGGKDRRTDRFETGRLPTDPIDTTDFDSKQRAMVRLFYKQLPRIAQLEDKMQAYRTGLVAMDSLLSYPANVEAYQDSALRVMLHVRNFLAEVEREVRYMHYEWLPLQQDLMAVHTKYGELWVTGRADKNLQRVIQAYRQLYARMQELLKQRAFLFNESEFLLNAKLDGSY